MVQTIDSDPLARLLSVIEGIPPEILTLAEGITALVFVGVVYKFISSYLNRASKRIELDEHTVNSIRLIIRVLTMLVATSIIFTLYELPTDIFVGGSALVGAIVGFGSSQTINNVAAGFYVLISRPFKVKDYVKIGDIEGQVEEITINYTKLYTPSFNMMLIPNTQVMSNRVLNCTHEGLIKYTFTLTVPHSDLNNETIAEKCLKPAIDEYVKKHKKDVVRRPEFLFDSSIAFGRSFKVRFFVPKGEAKTLYTLQPELYAAVMNNWDVEKASLRKNV